MTIPTLAVSHSERDRQEAGRDGLERSRLDDVLNIGILPEMAAEQYSGCRA